MPRVLCAMLICSDEACDEEHEAWGELQELEALLCEGCGCGLLVISLSEARLAQPSGAPRRPRRRPAAPAA